MYPLVKLAEFLMTLRLKVTFASASVV